MMQYSTQVYFQNNPLSGAFILAGMFLQSSRVAVHEVIALVAGNLGMYNIILNERLGICTMVML